MRNAWNVSVDGSISCGRPFFTLRMIPARRAVVSIGSSPRASTIALAILLAIGSSPYWRMIRVSSYSSSVLTRSAALAPSDPMRMSRGPSKRNENPRDASSSCIDETPRSASRPLAAVTPDCFRISMSDS